jgi:hypothetical protein
LPQLKGGDYYVKGDTVGTILNGDEYKFMPGGGDLSNAVVGVWGNSVHTAKVTQTSSSQVSEVRGKLGGLSGLKTSTPANQGYDGEIRFYEKYSE